MLREINSIMAYIQAYVSWPNITCGHLAALFSLMIFSLLMALELNYPDRPRQRKHLRQSVLSNAGLFLFNSMIVSFLTAASLLLVSAQYADKGLLRYIANPFGQALVAFLCLDLLLYGWHKVCHRFDFLWRVHRVHHSDALVNVSTAFRVHILEVLLTTLLKLGYLILLGVDQALMVLIEAIITAFVMFHHTNVSFYGEQWLAKIIIVPYLHRCHHSTERNQHDSNYGAVLSLWDKLFGTLQAMEPVTLGIHTPSPQSAIGLLCFGFGYSPKVQPQPVAMVCETRPDLDAWIAEAAYYKAEKRAFSPGNELSDWLEAKTEILRSMQSHQQLQI